MFKQNALVTAMVCGMFVSIYPQNSEAQTFKSAEFLGWSRENQSFYFRTSIGMAGLIVRQTDEKQADCIDSWYFRNEAMAHDQIVTTMRRFPTYHPLGVILAFLEKRCGSLTYQKSER